MDMVRDTLIEKGRLLAVQGPMGFHMDEVVNPKEKHHYDGHPIDQL
jgi:hypothetical protein